MPGGNGLATAERRARALAVWERLRAEGRAGWTPERRARFAATMARKYPKGPAAFDEIKAERDALRQELSTVRRDLASLAARVQALEERPVTLRLDHRRIVDGGRPVRLQLAQAGLPRSAARAGMRQPRPVRAEAVSREAAG